MSLLSLLYFKRRPHTHFDSHKHAARTEGIINFTLQVPKPHHGGQGCLAPEEPGDALPPGHPLAWLFLVLTTLANAGEPGGGAAEAGAEATSSRGGGGGQQAALEAGSAAGAHRGRAAMAGVLALRVVAGLAAAALAALLLEHYGLAGPPSPLPKPRDAQRPHPAPGSGAHNVFWGLQVTRREARDRAGAGSPAQQGASVACRLLGQRPARSFPGVPWRIFFFPFPRPRAAGPPLSFLTQIVCLCPMPAFDRYPTFT